LEAAPALAARVDLGAPGLGFPLVGLVPAAGAKLGADAKPRLVVLRGLKLNVEYPIYEGHNFVGRADEKPVDIDLDDQEPPDRVWSSRQHCLITFENGDLNLEDLNSANGTFVNRTRVYPGQTRPLTPNDVLQVGTVQLKLKV
jgi:pSer/pThr/pTyr-binding forkhead associated (FHA) protein